MTDAEIREALDQILDAFEGKKSLTSDQAQVAIACLRLHHEINRDEREYEASPAAIERRALGESESEGRTAI